MRTWIPFESHEAAADWIASLPRSEYRLWANADGKPNADCPVETGLLGCFSITYRTTDPYLLGKGLLDGEILAGPGPDGTLVIWMD